MEKLKNSDVSDIIDDSKIAPTSIVSLLFRLLLLRVLNACPYYAIILLKERLV